MKSTVILLDANIVIDFLLEREPGLQATKELVRKCTDGTFDAYIAFHTVSIVSYILRKKDRETAREYLRLLCDIFSIASATTEDVRSAIDMDDLFPDLEDCLQYKCAKHIGAEYIVTRNVKDFSGSDIQVMIPEALLEY